MKSDHGPVDREPLIPALCVKGMLPQVEDKLEHESLVTPGDFLAYQRRNGEYLEADPPTSAILLYQPPAWHAVREGHDGSPIDALLGDGYRLASASVAVFANFGIGGPVTASQVELLIEWGVERFIIAGAAGALQPDLDIGDVVIADGAVRDEGTSHHYLSGDESVAASPAIVADLAAAVTTSTPTFGDTWTTDAMFRETRLEVDQYREDGVLTVEMEAATLFAVAQFRNVEAGAIFTVSDLLTDESWDPRFGDLDASLADLVEIAIRAAS